MGLWEAETRHWPIAHQLYEGRLLEAEQQWAQLDAVDRADADLRALFAIAFIRNGNIERAVELVPAIREELPKLCSWLAIDWLLRLFNRSLLRRSFPAAVTCWFLARILGDRADSELFVRMYYAQWRTQRTALIFSLLLLARDTRNRSPNQCRSMWFYGFLHALNGLADDGVALVERGLARWREEHQSVAHHRYWLQEALAVKAATEFYGGRLDRALQTHRDTDAVFDDPRAWPFCYDFNNSMRLRTALAAGDRKTFKEALAVLRQALTDQFDHRFALRIHACMAVFHILDGDREESLRELGLADAASRQISFSHFERFYHVTQKSRVYLCEGLLELALDSARHAIDGLASGSATGYFVIDAHFQYLKCILVARALMTLEGERRVRLNRELRQCRKVLLRRTRGARILRERLLVLSVACRNAGRLPVAQTLKLLEQQSAILGHEAADVLMALRAPTIRQAECARYEGAARAAAESLQRLQQLSSYVRSLEEAADAHRQPRTLLQRALPFLRQLLRCDEASVTEVEPPAFASARALAPGIELVQEGDAPKGDMLFRFPLGELTLRIACYGCAEHPGYRRDLLETLQLWHAITAARLNDVIRADEMLRQQSFEAIARTTQMLAHDVRRPFSLVRVSAHLMSGAKTLEDARQIADEVLPEVDAALESVTGMLEDILLAGGQRPVALQEVTLESLVAKSIGQVALIYPGSNVTFGYAWEHEHLAKVDAPKFDRVVSNVIGNGFQAMKSVGHMWFATREIVANERRMLELTIGNSGSQIADADLPHIFEAFVSRNKPGGTGLGLAIARKIVTDHGGRISAASSDRGVEFRFTIPAGARMTETSDREQLPTNSAAASVLLARAAESSDELGAAQLERALLERLGQHTRKPVILLVDDEAAYRRMLIAHLHDSPVLKGAFAIEEAANSTVALRMAREHEPEVALLDIDLGPGSLNGFELVPRLRAIAPDMFICMHSNRTRSSDYRQTLEANANSHCLKPMSRLHLLKLLLMALPNADDGRSRRSRRPAEVA